METFNRLLDQFNKVINPNKESIEIGAEPNFHINSPPSLRCLMFRSCPHRGRKILFDSSNVTSEGFYQKQTDGKFLKEVLAEFIFGSIEINFIKHSFRFTTLTDKDVTYFTWAIVFPHWNSQQNLVQNDLKPTSSLPCNKPVSSSSSGYSSLPSFNSCQKRTTKTTLSLVLLTESNLKQDSDLIEKSLLELKDFLPKIYLTKNFIPVLKNFVNSLSIDLYNYKKLIRIPIRNKNHFKILINFKLLNDLINLLINNKCNLIIVSSKNSELIESLFYLNNLIKNNYNFNNFNQIESYDSLGYFSFNSFEQFQNSDTESDEENEEFKTKTSFYLDEIEDEQTENKLALGEVNDFIQKDFIQKPTEIQLDFEKIPEKCNVNCYNLSNQSKYISLVDNLLIKENVNYDYVHSLINRIVEVNLDNNFIRSFNCDNSNSVNQVLTKVKELVDLGIDQDKIEGYFIVHLFSGS